MVVPNCEATVPTMHALRSITLFSGLSAEGVARAEAACRWHERSSGELVIDQKDTSTDVYFLTKGRARVVVYSSSGKAVACREIEAGDMFGELAAIDGQPGCDLTIAVWH